MNRQFTLPLEVRVTVYEKYGDKEWAQKKYLVSGIDDVLWTDKIEHVISYIKQDLERLEKA